VSLPCDLHSLIYSFLEIEEKLIFISISKEITSHARSYRVMGFSKLSLEYVHNESFRKQVSSLVLPCHLELHFTFENEITDAELSSLEDVGFLHFFER
jgi:hypothetical protein